MPIIDFPFMVSFPGAPSGSSLPAAGPGDSDSKLPASVQSSERKYKDEIIQARRAYIQSLYQAASFYSELRQFRTAQACLEQLLQVEHSAEGKALVLLTLGQFSESCDDYPLAVDYYSQGLALEPVEPEVWYLINNNLGFSLNALGRFEDGEPYCREAVKINPKRHNAYKNLGISLQGTDRLLEAARSYLLAAQIEIHDTRALHLLEDLVQMHPELLRQDAGLAGEIEACQRAVAAAREARRLLRENRRPDENHPAGDASADSPAGRP
jgi:tetratricopeptide (TPR) repeat protein